MKTLLKAALFFGIAPLVTGIAIFIAWALTRAGWLEGAGLLTILAGTCSVVVGVVCLAIYLWRLWRSGTIPRRRLVWQAVAILGLYCVNFIAAGAAILGADAITRLYTVTVINESDHNFANTVIVYDFEGKSANVGDVAPGKSAKRVFLVNEGPIVLRGTYASRAVEVLIDDVSGSGGERKVVIAADGKISATNPRRHSQD